MRAFKLATYFGIIFSVSLFAEETKPNPESPQADPSKISEAFGHMIAKNMENLGFDFDLEALVKGLQDHKKGKNSPLSDNECIEAISVAQEAHHMKQASENLEKSQSFLAENAKKEGIQVIENGKLQYKVVHSGSGEEVKQGFSPSIKYIGKFLDGSIFGASKEEETVCLDETIPGFRSAIIGMKEGEKREIFIHPDLGYGTYGNLPPNSLLHFEVEVVKANNPIETPSLQAKEVSPETIR